jgi:ferritin-like metal-binding protein YciE
MTIATLEELLVDQLQDLYDAEKQLVKTLPKLVKNAASDDLRETIADHLEQTKTHVARLEQAFEELGENAKSKPCKGMRGLIEEGGDAMNEDAEGPFADLAMIAAAQKVEHYEISAYGTARAMAMRLGQVRVASLLEETEEEEKATDAKLTEVAGDLMSQAGEAQEEAEDEEVSSEEEKERPSRKRSASQRGSF